MSVLANAGENIKHFASVRLCVLHTIGRQDQQSIRVRKIDKLPVRTLFAANKMPLEFDKNIFPAEPVDQKLREILKVLGSARAPACNIRRLAECITSIREIFRSRRASGEDAGNCTRGACAP